MKASAHASNTVRALEEMARPQTLENLFGAFVNQGTLEEAALLMAELSKAEPGLRGEFESCLNNGVALAASGCKSVVEAVNRSGYRVATLSEAGDYCAELLSLYRMASDA